MVPLDITVVSAKNNDGFVEAIVRATRPGRSVIRMQLRFRLAPDHNPWTAAYDEALKYLDVA